MTKPINLIQQLIFRSDKKAKSAGMAATETSVAWVEMVVLRVWEAAMCAELSRAETYVLKGHFYTV